ncbi:hypothetical protein [Microbulbifer sp. MCCC 1A16149]|uniref:hypothetical protein n=1 Tax=Microbulbifer sp. MCCC 1A16149 TaxID=3411322 RepID=UPI003D0B30B1
MTITRLFDENKLSNQLTGLVGRDWCVAGSAMGGEGQRIFRRVEQQLPQQLSIIAFDRPDRCATALRGNLDFDNVGAGNLEFGHVPSKNSGGLTAEETIE